MGLLTGKVAIITGAGGGLGEAYAKLFAKEGARVLVNDLGGPRDGSGSDATAAQKVVDDIRMAGGEAVANAVRHAEATRVAVRLGRTCGSLEVEVRDDGRGLDGVVRGSGVGLTSMRERCEELGGAFALASGPGGTTVTARLPLPATEPETEQDAS